METVRGPMRFCLAIALFGPYLFISGCKPCHKCEELPSEVTHMLGEWEWYLTRRGTEVGTSWYSDYITPASSNSTVRIIFTDDGCMKFFVNDKEHHACVKHNQYLFFPEPGGLSLYQCAESNHIDVVWDDLEFPAGLVAYGQNCGELDTLKGSRIPFNENFTLLTPPPLPVGHELQGYTNYFKRIK